jgi:hypothetical protein
VLRGKSVFLVPVEERIREKAQQRLERERSVLRIPTTDHR